MKDIRDFTAGSEEDIYSNVLLFNDSLQTDCESAAMDLCVVIANVCFSWNSIIHSLVRIFVRPLYYLGVEKNHEVLNWVKWFIEYKKSGEYTEKISFSQDKSLEWFYKHLNENKMIIDTCFEELKICSQLQDIYISLKLDTVDNCLKYIDEGGKKYSFCGFDDFKEFTYKYFENKVPPSEVDRLIAEESDFFAEKFSKQKKFKRDSTSGDRF